MPSVSNTARIGPPAMMPVPCGAARRMTLPAPQRPCTSWCSVRPSRSGTRIMARFAASVALRIASGTSRALPWPKPTRPFWSPTTTRAAKPKRRPPFTTLATRLMWTSLSTNSLSRSSRCALRSLGSLAIVVSTSANAYVRSPVNPLELQPALARRVGQRLHAAVIAVTRPVEDHLFDAGLHGSLGDPTADRLGGFHVGAGLERLAHVLVERRGRSQRAPLSVVDDLDVDLLRRAEHRQARASVRG